MRVCIGCGVVVILRGREVKILATSLSEMGARGRLSPNINNTTLLLSLVCGKGKKKSPLAPQRLARAPSLVLCGASGVVVGPGKAASQPCLLLCKVGDRHQTFTPVPGGSCASRRKLLCEERQIDGPGGVSPDASPLPPETGGGVSGLGCIQVPYARGLLPLLTTPLPYTPF